MGDLPPVVYSTIGELIFMVISNYEQFINEFSSKDYKKYFGISKATVSAWKSNKFNIRKPYLILANMLYNSKVKVDTALSEMPIKTLEQFKKLKKELSSKDCLHPDIGVCSHNKICEYLGISGRQTIRGWSTRKSEIPKVYLVLLNILFVYPAFFKEVFEIMNGYNKQEGN